MHGIFKHRSIPLTHLGCIGVSLCLIASCNGGPTIESDSRTESIHWLKKPPKTKAESSEATSGSSEATSESSTSSESFPETGLPRLGSFQGNDFETVNRRNLNFLFQLPIVSKPGRGLSFGHGLTYNSLIYRRKSVPNSNDIWTPLAIDGTGSGMGWTTAPNLIGSASWTESDGACNYPCEGSSSPGGGTEDSPSVCTYEYTHFYNYVYREPDGTVRRFPSIHSRPTTLCQSSSEVLEGYASDGSGYYMELATSSGPATVWAPDGTRIEDGSITDRNGNMVLMNVVDSTTTEYVDTLGEVVLRIEVQDASGEDWKLVFSVPNGREETTGEPAYVDYVLTYQDYLIGTSFECADVDEYTSGTPVRLPVELLLPDQTTYRFEYEPTSSQGNTTGRLARVTFPTGGFHEYIYPTGAGFNCDDGTVTDLLKRRVEFEDNTEIAANEWHFVRTEEIVSPDETVWTTQIIPPKLPYDETPNEITHRFETVMRQVPVSPPNGGQTYYETYYDDVETQKAYQGTAAQGQLLLSTETVLSKSTESASYFDIKQVTTTLDDNSRSLTRVRYDRYNHVIEEEVFDYDSLIIPVRKTTRSYIDAEPYRSRRITDLIEEVVVADGSGTPISKTTFTYDDPQAYVCSPNGAESRDPSMDCDSSDNVLQFGSRGNLTGSIAWPDPAATTTPTVANGALITTLVRDQYGNVLETQLNGRREQHYDYDPATQYAYPLQVTAGPETGPNLSTLTTYNPYNGSLISTTDANEETVQYFYDSLGRPERIESVEGTMAAYGYDPTARTTSNTIYFNDRRRQITTSYFDSLGRPTKTLKTSGAGDLQQVSKIDLDVLGRTWKVYNPDQDESSLYTERRFDGLGRILKQIPPAAGEQGPTVYAYDGSSVTTTDPTGRKRKTEQDGLGRTAIVSEPNTEVTDNPLNVDTIYHYSPLDQLLRVEQGEQNRIYDYDDLGRIESMTTPEGGTERILEYNDYGDVKRVQDGRGVVAIYTFDALHRLKQTRFDGNSLPAGVPQSDTVDILYGGDPALKNKGRVESITQGSGYSESYTYGTNGRVGGVTKRINGTDYTLGYTYNKVSQRTSLVYPNGRTVHTSHDAFGRPTQLYDDSNTYLSEFSYHPSGPLERVVNGDNIEEIRRYGNASMRLQELKHNRLYVNGHEDDGSTIWRFGKTLAHWSYGYQHQGSFTGVNGQITSVTDEMGHPNTLPVYYEYDALGRLSGRAETYYNYPEQSYPAHKWGYDRYGNRTADISTHSKAPYFSAPMPDEDNAPAIDPSTNRIANYQYDDRGNLLADDINTYVYDAANRLVEVNTPNGTWNFHYDTAGKRVRISQNGQTIRTFLRDGNWSLAEYPGNNPSPSAPEKEYISLGAKRVAYLYNFDGYNGYGPFYVLQDRLNERLTTYQGRIQGRNSATDFGRPGYSTGYNTDRAFTTYDDDTTYDDELHLQYALHRFYDGAQGRFSSPDPILGNIHNPQSWNRYSYSLNDPINRWDPTGLAQDQTGKCTTQESGMGKDCETDLPPPYPFGFHTPGFGFIPSAVQFYTENVNVIGDPPTVQYTPWNSFDGSMDQIRAQLDALHYNEVIDARVAGLEPGVYRTGKGNGLSVSERILSAENVAGHRALDAWMKGILIGLPLVGVSYFGGLLVPGAAGTAISALISTGAVGVGIGMEISGDVTHQVGDYQIKVSANGTRTNRRGDLMPVYRTLFSQTWRYSVTERKWKQLH